MTTERPRNDDEASVADDNATEEEALQAPINNRTTFIHRASNKPSFSNIFSKYSGCVLAGSISFISFFSPIFMVLIPKFGGSSWPTDECLTDCQSLLISFCTRLLILLLGTWALFWRRPTSNMPRVFKGRATVVLILFILVSVYWLFYVVRIIVIKEVDYLVIVSFSSNIVDCLICVHYLSVVLVVLKQGRGGFVVKVVRSPDGASGHFSVGSISVQRLAIMCLDHHHTQFQAYNPYFDRMMASRRAKMARTCDFKIYNMDPSEEPSTSHQGGVGKERDGGKNVGRNSDRGVLKDGETNRHGIRSHPVELMQLEEGYERKVQKRKWRLVVAAEQSFENIRNLQIQENNGFQLSNSYEAAQAVFAGLASPLQKYLRTTRQQPCHSVDSIIVHIEQCLLFNLSHKAFLSDYLSQDVVAAETLQDWTLLCKVNVNANIYEGAEFCLRRNGVSLMVMVSSLPFFNLSEGAVLGSTPSTHAPTNFYAHPSTNPSIHASTHLSTIPPSLPPRHTNETHV